MEQQTEQTSRCATALGAPACFNCGFAVEPGGRGMGRDFCQASCRLQFNARQKARGAVLAPLVLAWALTRNAKPGTPEKETYKKAFRDFAQIARIYNDEDKEAGRPPADAYAAKLLASGSRYIDRRRNP